ncbi:alkane hydroxylase MAH1-like [Papaver somniferum]|uniref:alkane hydroxylase MAH1-like n=1 Tax=Papaver somniferum TaxID=3469 RepID=UPI000E6FA16E|nr:alkane hydroxylase MAH1-like [Papaver somniferum]
MDSQYTKLNQKCKESYNSVLVLLFCLILSALWYFIHYKLILRWPNIGKLLSIIFNAHRIHDWTVDISKACGSTIVGRGPFFRRLEIVYTCDPRNAKYILATNYNNFSDRQDYSDAFDIFGDGLLTAASNFWTAQRRVSRLTFNSKTVRNIISHKGLKVVQDSLLPLLSYFSKDSSVVDLQDVLMRYMLDTSIDIIFGKRSSYLSISLPPNEFGKAMNDASEAIFYRHVVPISWWKLSRRLKIGSNEKKLEAAWKIIDRHISKYIKAKRETMVAKGSTNVNEHEENGLLDVYMSIKDGEKDELMLSKMCTDKFFRDTCINFLIAGRDSTGSTLSWFFWLIFKNPSAEAKILEELELVIISKKINKMEKKHPVMFDAVDQTWMVYLHAAICESLRLYPAVPLLRKTSTNNDVFPDGTEVCPGMTVIISLYAMGRMECVWGKDCLEFKPERWIGEDGKLNPETMSKFFSFSLGPRNCIGKDMAFVLMKLVSSAIIYNFHLEVLEGQNIVPAPAINFRMMNGLMVRLRERERVSQ